MSASTFVMTTHFPASKSAVIVKFVSNDYSWPPSFLIDCADKGGDFIAKINKGKKLKTYCWLAKQRGCCQQAEGCCMTTCLESNSQMPNN
jgi:hypothetical protein